ncbi:hypothetical protein, partial [Bacillus pumilus]|uniref:hypothetical protein n=1 Tax=Bacillus pumilus TaxID=1408 RepID=UPI001C92E903
KNPQHPYFFTFNSSITDLPSYLSPAQQLASAKTIHSPTTIINTQTPLLPFTYNSTTTQSPQSPHPYTPFPLPHLNHSPHKFKYFPPLSTFSAAQPTSEN